LYLIDWEDVKGNSQNRENIYRNSELGLKIRFWAKRLFGGLFPAFCIAI
jgi:hypothetical protein